MTYQPLTLTEEKTDTLCGKKQSKNQSTSFPTECEKANKKLYDISKIQQNVMHNLKKTKSIDKHRS